MNNRRYILEPYNGKRTRFTCPQCGKYREFARYIDTEAGEYLAPDVGRCNREQKCGYHYKPHQYFENNNIEIKKPIIKLPQPPKKKTSYIDRELIQKAMRRYEINRFVQFLEKYFNIKEVYNVLRRYCVGTSNHWPGTTVFPQIDTQGRTRTAKLMQYDPNTGKRIKKPHTRITWLHSVLKIENFNLKQCLFGEHLIPNAKRIGVVESEKTAIIAALVWPKYTWIATGGKHGAKFYPSLFKGKQVILFPDIGVDWTAKAKEIPGSWISTITDNYATEEDYQNGSDLADLLLRDITLPQWELSLSEQKFEAMAAKNPALRLLLQKFNCKMIECNDFKKLSKEELQNKALDLIGECNHVDKTAIPYFDEMLNHGLLTQAKPLDEKYYLTGSTPF